MSVRLELKIDPFVDMRTGYRSYKLRAGVVTQSGSFFGELTVSSAGLRGVLAIPLKLSQQFDTRALAASKQNIRSSVNKQEKKIAESIGGRRQPGSGALEHYKSDGRVEGKFRIENKMTQAESFSMKLKDLRKLRSECVDQEVPLFEVEFREKVTLRPKDKWALLPWAALERLINEAARNDK